MEGAATREHSGALRRPMQSVGPDAGLRSRSNREYLLDVSRLIWRTWRGGLPTGVDRVCLAYLDHFAGLADAVVQRSGRYWVLSSRHSDELFDLLRGSSVSRTAIIGLAIRAWAGASRGLPRAGKTYLNVGHTGLNDPNLPKWIADNGLRAVFLVHDLIPITHPQFCRPGEAEKHRQRMANVLDCAAGVIGNSRATIDTLADFAAETGRQLPANVVAWISGNPVPEPRQARSMATPHFVTVGTIEGRKNHLLLLQLWQRLVRAMGENAPTLLIIGQRGWEAEPAIRMLDQLGDLSGHVRELSTCSDQEMAEWIAGARALLMPSFVEGFGLPVIEALQLGTPVIATDLPVFREISGDIPVFLDPNDAAAWEHAILSFIGSGRSTKVQPEPFRPPDWSGHFHTVEGFLRRL